ncbi:hypothetical protein EPK99_05110 [Neorhizobium lilium]|uniref:Transposase n=1 Tax=Neorhizobium lilium TaxID=2503024 RepID=A0A444LMT4_9HYPH|nr:hypothetical protein EPK99_05110 [Neorhizobium lilium]
MNKRYSDELRERAVALVDERRIRNPRDRTIFRVIADELAVGEQSLRLWVKQFDKARVGASEKKRKLHTHSDQPPEHVEAELEILRKKIEKLQAENDVLKRAFVVFSSEWSE